MKLAEEMTATADWINTTKILIECINYVECAVWSLKFFLLTLSTKKMQRGKKGQQKEN